MNRAPTLALVTPDLGDDEVLRQMWQVRERCEYASRVLPQRQSQAEFVLDARFTFPGERDETAVVVAGGQVIARGRIWFPEHDNLELCWSEVHVDPEHRGKGAGSALLDWFEHRARAHRRSVHATEIFVPVGAREDHPARRFAERRGYALASTEIVRRLELPVADDVLGPLERLARPFWECAYELSVHRSGVPQELRPSLCAAMNRLALDAPTGDLDIEEESLDPEGYQQVLDHEARIARQRLTAVAVHRDTGVVAAYSDLALPAGDVAVAHQWGTLVLPEHRGHRLGTAVKLANLRQLQWHDPGRSHVVTANAEDNPWMVGINEALGFRIVEEVLTLTKDLG